ncbi:helix-turn-helix domain-containing protein [Corallococcus sp. BB11-1]|uniref:helix-turn-helix domain-containing protein n=1 Tax=Corallococcus sp. BB11-1 TaxID=2996783 RepID=UPI002270FD75|nr:helix-turn-helix domain-containing protein [Corallococcus sp. BB11-1]MCY1033969.1 helix-turn-helix domain-containing protein [Corallococcus sp. BB11-1]
MSKSLGKRIRRARLQSNRSQAFVAEKLKVTQTTISNWEKGKTEPDEGELKKLERHLGGIVSPSKSQSETESAATEGPSPFGAWLSKSRLNKDLSVAELSNASGVSIPTIYGIEAGRIENPRTETIRKFEKAFGEKAPDDLITEMEEEARIEGLGGLTDFNPHETNSLPSTAGVYVLYDISERPMYVGMGGNIGKRIQDHHEKFWFKKPIVETGSYVEIKDELLRKQVETLLIKFLKSNAVINKQGVDR